MITDKNMSPFVRVRIKAEPKRVEQTSPERFAGGENIFIRKYPKARAPTEIIATEASPLILEFSLEHNMIIAQIIVRGRIKRVVADVIFKIEAIAIAPKAV